MGAPVLVVYLYYWLYNGTISMRGRYGQIFAFALYFLARERAYFRSL